MPFDEITNLFRAEKQNLPITSKSFQFFASRRNLIFSSSKNSSFSGNRMKKELRQKYQLKKVKSSEQKATGPLGKIRTEASLLWFHFREYLQRNHNHRGRRLLILSDRNADLFWFVSNERKIINSNHETCSLRKSNHYNQLRKAILSNHKGRQLDVTYLVCGNYRATFERLRPNFRRDFNRSVVIVVRTFLLRSAA